MSVLAQTPNAAWRQYKKEGGSIEKFHEWLHREKEKTFSAAGTGDTPVVLVNRSLNDTVQQAINQTLKQGGLKEQESGKTVFGINKNILIASGIIITGAIAYLIIKKNKST